MDTGTSARTAAITTYVRASPRPPCAPTKPGTPCEIKVCENCYDTHLSGRVNNSLGKQVISNKVEDHRFALHKDKGFTPLVKKARSDSAI